MKLSVMLAVDNDFVIGYNDDLVYHCSKDLQRFKSVTTNKTVIMGRKTFESLPITLRNRNVIIVSKSYKENDIHVPTRHYVVSSYEDALLRAKSIEPIETIVVGGKSLYEWVFPIADKFYMTLFNHTLINRDGFYEGRFIQVSNYELLLLGMQNFELTKYIECELQVNVLPDHHIKNIMVHFLEYEQNKCLFLVDDSL